jgi:hypothetical protein
MRLTVPAVFAALLLVLTLSASARAQSVIAGVVKDTSGAVLPGIRTSPVRTTSKWVFSTTRETRGISTR